MGTKIHTPILITGAERSGSTLIARILGMCGVWSGHCNRMYENKRLQTIYPSMSDSFFPKTEMVIPFGFKEIITDTLEKEGWSGQKWMVKGSKLAQHWPLWHFVYPDAKWVLIRRRTGDVIQSCIKTGYMRTFKGKENLTALGFEKEEEGWLWWVHQYENKFVEITQSGVNCRIIWPDRMAIGDYDQIKETLDWLGINWNNKIPEVISPLLEKGRRMEQCQE